MNDEPLSWVIFTFRTQFLDDSNSNGDILERMVTIKSNNGERWVQGTSERSRIYPVRIGIGRTDLRLIDTPDIGPGDGITRADIIRRDDTIRREMLSTLRSFDKLHGILILLNSNHQRLTIALRYCIEGLLAVLDRDAMRNIVFGFTNTRHSNYIPGDTFMPLQTLLEEHADVGLRLS
jgi:hypothetical protein